MDFVAETMTWAVDLQWRDVLEHAKSFALPLAGVYVAHKFGSIQAEIGRQQAATAAESKDVARNKLRFDLFDRRLAIFKGADKLIKKVTEGRRVTAEDLVSFLEATGGAEWLFDKKTANYVSRDIFSDGFDLVSIWEQENDEADPNERRKLYLERKELKQAFARHNQMLRDLMEPYLRFKETR